MIATITLSQPSQIIVNYSGLIATLIVIGICGIGSWLTRRYST